MTDDLIERNWDIWRTYCLSERTQADVAADYGVGASRVSQIYKKFNKRIGAAMAKPGKGYTGRFIAETLDSVSIVIESGNERQTHRNRPWYWANCQLYNPWTGMPIPEAAKYFTRAADSTYCWRIAKPTEPGAITLIRAKTEASAPVTEKQAPPAPPAPPAPSDTPVSDLPLTVRVRNCLLNAGYRTLADVLAIDYDTLEAAKSWYNFGRKSRNELVEFLRSTGGLKPLSDEEREIRQLRVQVNQLTKRLELSEHQIAANDNAHARALQIEKEYAAKLRNIISKLSSQCSLNELRDAGIAVDLRVFKGR